LNFGVGPALLALPAKAVSNKITKEDRKAKNIFGLIYQVL
jgi:hypothetical protein